MSASAAKPGWNLATRSAEERAAINADLIACRIRWECRGLKGEAKSRKGNELLSQVPLSSRPAVIEALKRRGK